TTRSSQRQLANRPDLADPPTGVRRQGDGADLGPEERRLYRLIPRNQGIPGARGLGYDGPLSRPKTGGIHRMTRAFVFPGQGSQAVGMGADLAGAFGTARDVLQEVDEALKQNLSTLMAVSVAVIRILEKDGGKPLAGLASHVAGHSLGEYSALAAAGALELADAARLLKLRGQSMQKAVPVGVGAMAALLGIELEAAQEACKEAAQGQIVAVANDNGGGQVVVSGHKEAVERAIEAAKAKGCKRGM